MSLIVEQIVTADGFAAERDGGIRFMEATMPEDLVDDGQLAMLETVDAILLGRRTYEMFEPAWSVRTVEDDPGAPFFNDTTKYVVSGTLDEATWRNSEIIGAYDPDRIRRLKDEVGNLYVSGSGTLVRAMLADGLVDELHLCTFPLTRAEGPRLFEPEVGPRTLELAHAESYDNGVLYLNYRAA